MGLFMHRPEEPSEWAGLPSEPDRPQNAAERLVDAAPVDAVYVDILSGAGAGTGTAIESIVIPVAPVVEIIEAQESGEGV